MDKSDIRFNRDEDGFPTDVVIMPEPTYYEMFVPDPIWTKLDNRYIKDEIDVDFAEAHNLLREMGISDLAARNHLYSAKYRKYVEKTHLVRGNSVIWVKIVYLTQNDTFWLYAQNMPILHEPEPILDSDYRDRLTYHCATCGKAVIWDGVWDGVWKHPV